MPYRGRIIELTDRMFAAGGTDTMRFGRLRSGETAVIGFRLVNATDRPAVVAGYDVNCGCVALEYDARPIAPDEARQMTLTFDSRGQWGWQLKVLELRLAGAAHPLRLVVEAEVR